MSVFSSNGCILQDQAFGSTQVSNLDEGKGTWVDDKMSYSAHVALTAAHHGKCVVLMNESGGALNVTLPTPAAASGWSVTVVDGTSTRGDYAIITSVGGPKILGLGTNSGALTVSLAHTSVAVSDSGGNYGNRISLTSDGTNYVVTQCACKGNCTATQLS